MSPKVLVISDIACSEKYAGGAVLKSVVETLPLNYEVVQIVIGSPFLSYDLNELNRGPLYYTQKPHAQWQGVSNRFIRFIGQSIARKFETPPIVAWVQQILASEEPNYVIFAPQCQILSDIIVKLDTKGATTISFMWDHPSWFAREHNLTRFTAKKFVRDWLRVFEDSDIRVLPSENAKSLFHSNELQKPKDLVIYPRLSKPFDNSEMVEKPVLESTIISIGFAGNTYASSEIRAFVEALEEANWSLDGNNVELHLLTHGTEFDKYPQVHFHGWQTPDDAVDILGRLDFAFLPYPLSGQMKLVAETSFPSKVALYLAAKLPILYFGPENTAVSDFLQETKCGMSLRLGQIVEDLALAAQDRERLAIGAQTAYVDFFSEDAANVVVSEIFSIPKTLLNRIKPDSAKAGNTNTQIGNSRIDTRTWDDIQTPSPTLGIVNFRTWIATSKYLYILSRPGEVAKRVNQKKQSIRQVFGRVCTNIALWIFGKIISLAKNLLNSGTRFKSPTDKYD